MQTQLSHEHTQAAVAHLGPSHHARIKGRWLNAGAAQAAASSKHASSGASHASVPHAQPVSGTSHTQAAQPSSGPSPRGPDPHPADCITIDTGSSPWDGPHPGLAAGQGTFGPGPARRAPIGIVRLPASLTAPRRRGRNPPRHAGGFGATHPSASTSHEASHQDSALPTGASKHAGQQPEQHSTQQQQQGQFLGPPERQSSVQGMTEQDMHSSGLPQLGERVVSAVPVPAQHH